MIIDAAGTPRELGRAHGEQARDVIASGLGRWRDELAKTDKDADQLWKGLSRGSGFREAATRWAPALLEEIEGIAEGANADPDAIFATNCLDEAWWWDEKGHGCSAVAVADRGGKTVIGQNMDLDTWMDSTQVALRLRPDDGPQQVLLSRAGVVGLCGANAEGIGLVVNTLDQLPVAVDGLPVALVLRLLAAQTSLDDVEPLLRSIRHASGQAYTMASADDVIGFEAGGDFVASYVNDASRPGARWHTNHPLSDGDHEVTFDPGDWATGSSAPRLSRVDDAMSDIATDDDLVELLSDADAGICMYPGRWRDDGFTFGSLVIEIDEPPTVRIAPGPPDRTAWIDVPFA
ncbi:MAG: C45 family peptidase [Actinomycetes bacterium]